MQQTESEDIREPEQQAPEEASPEQTDDEASQSWWGRLTNKLFLRSEPQAEPQPEESTPEQAAEPGSRTVTDAELQRLVQSEVDRREAFKNKQQRDAERKRLRDEDPWAYAEQERQQEQAQTQDNQLTDLLQNIGHAHDEVTLKPLMETLEPAERERLMSLPGAGVGADGRKLLTEQALKSLEKRWRAEGAKDAEAKLRKSSAFRKQVLSEFNGGFASPEVLPSGSASRPQSSSQEVNDMLRQQLGIHREA